MRITRLITVILMGLLVTLEACGQPETLQTTPTPRVLEKDIPDLTATQSLKFQLSIGDRVEGKVTVNETWPYEGSVIWNSVLSTIRDPYGNTVFQSAIKEISSSIYTPETRSIIVIRQESNQRYPWGFAFLPSTNGEYTLEVKKISGTIDYPANSDYWKGLWPEGVFVDQPSEKEPIKEPIREIISVHLKVTIYRK